MLDEPLPHFATLSDNPIEVGSKVRILQGDHKGRIGTVKSLYGSDGKMRVRVAVDATEEALIEAMNADDAAAVLIYADLLEERDASIKAEVLRRWHTLETGRPYIEQRQAIERSVVGSSRNIGLDCACLWCVGVQELHRVSRAATPDWRLRINLTFRYDYRNNLLLGLYKPTWSPELLTEAK